MQIRRRNCGRVMIKPRSHCFTTVLQFHPKKRGVSYTNSTRSDGVKYSIMAASKYSVFLSHRSSDKPAVETIGEWLQVAGVEPWLDKWNLIPGQPWQEEIEKALRECSACVVFIGPQGRGPWHNMEMRAAINRCVQEGNGYPVIPVLLPGVTEEEREELPLFLSTLLWVKFRTLDDSEALHRLLCGIKGIAPGRSASSSPVNKTTNTAVPIKPPPPELPEGTMDLASPFYVARPQDEVAQRLITGQSVTIAIKGPRQVGKSSLLMRTIGAAMQAGKRVALLDFQLIGQDALGDAECFFRQFCSWLSHELGLEDVTARHWSSGLSLPQRCTNYVQSEVLPAMNASLVIAIDEAETLLHGSFTTDFFAMLRAWHNKRAQPSTPVWKKLSLVLVISTEPYQLIRKLNQSPFNVARNIEVGDFTPAQVADLNQRHAEPLKDDEVQQLVELSGGHPYLVRRTLYLVTYEQASFHDLWGSASSDDGPFHEHLQYHLLQLQREPELKLEQGLQQVLRHHTCSDDGMFLRLQSAGLVRREDGQVRLRCRLYEVYFQRKLHV